MIICEKLFLNPYSTAGSIVPLMFPSKSGILYLIFFWYSSLVPHVGLIRQDKWLQETSSFLASCFLTLSSHYFHFLVACLNDWWTQSLLMFDRQILHSILLVCMCVHSYDKQSFLIYSIYLERLPRNDSDIPVQRVFYCDMGQRTVEHMLFLQRKGNIIYLCLYKSTVFTM